MRALLLLVVAPAVVFAPAVAFAEPSSQPTDGSVMPAAESHPLDQNTINEGIVIPVSPSFKVNIDGYTRVRLTFTQGDPNAPYVGINNGFNLANARLEINADYKNKLFIRTSIEGGLDRQNTPNQTVGQLSLGLKDAFIAYEPWHFLRFQIGQMKAPFDAEELVDTNDLLFITRAVYADGVRATEGFYQPGLGIDRELGLRVSGEKIRLGHRVFFNYYAAVTNGNADNMTVNDNNSFAAWGRAELHVPYVRIGAASYYNPATNGTFPNLFDVNKVGATTDIDFRLHGFDFRTEFLYTELRYPTTSAPISRAYGAHAQVAYHFWFGLTPAYRIAFYEPNDKIDFDQLLYHTLAINYDLPWVPLRVMANGTLTGEQSARALKNNQLDFCVQANFP